MSFPKGFIWGAATSAYQIEGGHDADGKGQSIWDVFCRIDGVIERGESGDIACDHYHRFREDVALMKQIGIQGYRFSISWARIYPDGIGKVNKLGIEFYNKLIDALLAHGIKPYITLYHWDLPYALEKKGGWLNRDTADAFAVYAQTVADSFSDRVDQFITLNEPQVSLMHGYQNGIHAPGRRLEHRALLEVSHNLLLAHGKAVSAIRESAKQPVSIGIASTGSLCYPETELPGDVKMAKKLCFTARDEDWGFTHQWFLDPIFYGWYPEIDGKDQSHLMDFIQADDWDIIRQPIDFAGYNIYNGHEISAEDGGRIIPYQGSPRTALKWPVTPGVLNYGLRFLYERYPVPIFITENGLSCNDKIYLDGKVHDPDRIVFLHRYLMEMEEAVEAGVDLRGYFHWSLLDNF